MLRHRNCASCAHDLASGSGGLPPSCAAASSSTPTKVCSPRRALVARLLGRKLGPECLRKGDLLTSSRFRKRVRARPRCGNSGARLAATGRGVERPWRRSHGANLNPASAVFPAVAVSAKPSHVSDRFTATTAAMEAASLRCACHCDIAASRPQDAIPQRRSLGSGKQAR